MGFKEALSLIEKLGISTKDVNGQFKSTEEIMEEISLAFNELGEEDKPLKEE